MKVLITGGSGFIGSHISDACVESGHKVFVYDDLSTGDPDNLPFGKTSIFNNSITEYEKLEETVKYHKFDCICHQAAQPSLRKSIDDPVFDATVNILGTLNVIKAAKEVGAHLVFASTSAVYNPLGQPPFSEEDYIKPNLPYGIAKAAAEMYIANSGLSCTTLRYGNVYGPRQVKVGENQLIPHCLGYLLRGEPFVINGDGEQVRDFVYVKDIARANLMAMEKKPQGTFNCGTGNMHSVNDVCDALFSIHYGNTFDGEILLHGPSKPGEMRASGLNSQKAFDTFGWRAETNLYDGLRMTYEWAKAQ